MRWIDRKRWTTQERHQERVLWLRAHPDRLKFAAQAAASHDRGSLRNCPVDRQGPWRTIYRMMHEAGIYHTKALTDDIFPGVRRAVKEAMRTP